jgi:hypothetical protein
MTNPFKNNPKLKNNLIVGTILVIGFIFLYQFTFVGNIINQFILPNYAKEVAMPIEKALEKAGAVKVCESGDKGFGIDNDSPWYRAYIKTSLNKDDTVRILKETTKDNGYNLVQASPENRGYLDSIADAYIHKWYFDNSKKQTNNPLLKKEPIELSIGTENEKSIELSGLVCNTPNDITITSDKQNTLLQIEVSLPSFKRPYFF